MEKEGSSAALPSRGSARTGVLPPLTISLFSHAYDGSCIIPDVYLLASYIFFHKKDVVRIRGLQPTAAIRTNNLPTNF